MILDITEIKYFFIILNLKEFEYLVFLFFFFFFLFIIFVSYKTFKSIESGVASNTESESFVLGLNNWHLCPFPQLIYQFRHSYSNFQSTINQKRYSNNKNKIPWHFGSKQLAFMSIPTTYPLIQTLLFQLLKHHKSKTVF